MLDAIGREITQQIRSIRDAMRTREFWIYFGTIIALVAVAIGGSYFALGFDNLTRDKLVLMLACRTGEKQLGVIIVGAFVFTIGGFFALGEVAAWVEAWRRAKAVRRKMTTSVWRPIVAMLMILLFGLGGMVLMSAWCI